ncbi:MAG: hypothetical protein GX061_06040 [Eubacteriaceae bacterium]|nr:hypothetical protein [Eubacteriaceae bacterium]
MKKNLILFLMVLLVLAVATGCGGGKDSFADLTPSANIMPKDINRGMIRDNESTSGTSDKWYPNGEEGDVFIFFVQAMSESGISYHIMNGDIDKTVWCKVTNENHLVNEKDDDEVKIDIVFYDPFTAYDYVSETWYSRGDYDATVALLKGKTFVKEGDSESSFTFNEDGTYKELWKGIERSGEWKIENATQVTIGRSEYDLAYDEKGNLIGLDSYWGGEVTEKYIISE